MKMDSVLGSAVLGPGIPSLNSQPPAESLASFMLIKPKEREDSGASF